MAKATADKAQGSAPTDVVAEYRRTKQEHESSLSRAKTELQSQYEQYLTEAAQIKKNFIEDLGEEPKLPAGVRTFTIGDPVKPRGRKPKAEAAVTE